MGGGQWRGDNCTTSLPPLSQTPLLHSVEEYPGFFFGEKKAKEAEPLVKFLVSELAKGPRVRMYYPESWQNREKCVKIINHVFHSNISFFRRPPVCRF